MNENPKNKVLTCPDILYLDVKQRTREDDNCSRNESTSEDLNLEEFVSLANFNSSHEAFNSSYEAQAKWTIERLNRSRDCALYRQDAFRELLSDDTLRKNIETVTSQIGAISRFDCFHNSEAKAYGLLRNILPGYHTAIKTGATAFKDAKSRILKRLHTYFNEVKASSSFKELCDFLNNTHFAQGLDMRVMFNKKIYDGFDIEDVHITNLVGSDASQKAVFSDSECAVRVSCNDSFYLTVCDAISELTSTFLPQIREVTGLLPDLNFYSSFANLFSQFKEEGRAVAIPELLDEKERMTDIRGAWNPVILCDKNNRKIVPNNISRNRDNGLFVLTGPNNGGKTTYVKTVGLVQLLAQAGLPIPAQSGRVSIVDGIYTHFVSPDDITEGEGRYRNEMRRMREILEGITQHSMVILDEPCGGTSYEEGLEQSRRILGGLHDIGAATYFTTHMHPLAKEVHDGGYACGKALQVLVSKKKGNRTRYTYKVGLGIAGKSFGAEIAEECGVGKEAIEVIVKRKKQQQIKQ